MHSLISVTFIAEVPVLPMIFCQKIEEKGLPEFFFFSCSVLFFLCCRSRFTHFGLNSPNFSGINFGFLGIAEFLFVGVYLFYFVYCSAAK